MEELRKVNTQDFDLKNLPSKFYKFDKQAKIPVSTLKKYDRQWTSDQALSLGQLLTKTIPPNTKPNTCKQNKRISHFICEASHFPPEYYSSRIFRTKQSRITGIYFTYYRKGVQGTLPLDIPVPVDQTQTTTLWGIQLSNKTQVHIIMAWLKVLVTEKVEKIQPGDFIMAFTLPIWVLYKEIRQEQSSPEFMEGLVNKRYHIMLQTRDDERVRKAGLVENCFGYRIAEVRRIKGETLFVIESTIDCNWGGKYHFQSKQYLQNERVYSIQLSYQRKFIITRQQLEGYFCNMITSPINFSGLLHPPSNQPKRTLPSTSQSQSIPLGSLYTHHIKLQTRRKYTIQSLELPTSCTLTLCLITTHPAKLILSQYCADLKKSNDFMSSPEYKYVMIKRSVGPRQVNFQTMVTSVLDLEKGSYVLRVEVERAEGEDEVGYTLVGTAVMEFQLAQGSPDFVYEDSKFLSSAFLGYFLKHKDNPPKDVVVKPARGGHVAYGSTFESLGFGFIAVKVPFDQTTKCSMVFNPLQLYQMDHLSVHRYGKPKALSSDLIYPNTKVEVPVPKEGACLIFSKKSNEFFRMPPESFELTFESQHLR